MSQRIKFTPRRLRWPTLEDAIIAQYFKLRKQLRGTNLFLSYSDADFNRMAQRAAEQLKVAACNPYEVLEPREYWHFYNPATNELFKACHDTVFSKTWVWSGQEFSLEDWPILEFHHDLYLRTLDEQANLLNL